MKNARSGIVSWVFALIWLILGITLTILGATERLDSFWSGMGGGLTVVGALRLVMYLRYRSNPEYRQKVDTENRDERNRFISGRAWAWAGYLYVFAAAIGTLAFHFSGHDDLSLFCSFSICALVIFYYVSWLVLRKKY